MRTEDLILSLAQDLEPVKPIRSPARLLLLWLGITLPVLGLTIWLMGPRSDLPVKFGEAGFVTSEALGVATALISAYAAFCAGRPDQPGWKLWVPVLAMLLWLGDFGRQYLALSQSDGGRNLVLHWDVMCIPAIALAGIVPGIAMVVLLRQSAAFRTTHACLCGAMAAAALTETALRLFHQEPSFVTLLVWQVGSVALFTMAGGLIGRAVLSRPHGNATIAMP